MSVAILTESPLVLPTDLGPYRRHDYEALLDEPRCELIFGRFYVSPSPLLLHQIVVGTLFEWLRRIARRTGGLAVTAPLDVAFAEHSIVQPDVMYISPARRAIAQQRIEGAPDLLVEVLSRGTARRDRGEKLRLYAEFDVREYWIVDPEERQIEFLVNDGGRFVVALPEGGEYRSRALPEIHLDLAAFWREVDEQLAPA
jgi:Uma2 family endonuclease